MQYHNKPRVPCHTAQQEPISSKCRRVYLLPGVLKLSSTTSSLARTSWRNTMCNCQTQGGNNISAMQASNAPRAWHCRSMATICLARGKEAYGRTTTACSFQAEGEWWKKTKDSQRHTNAPCLIPRLNVTWHVLPLQLQRSWNGCSHPRKQSCHTRLQVAGHVLEGADSP